MNLFSGMSADKSADALCIIILYLNLVQIIFENDLIESHCNNILNYFTEFIFHDTARSVACSGQFVAQFIHERFVQYMLIGLVLLRTIMVKHANNIRTKNCKAHQARLSFIGILILIFVITNILGIIIVIFLSSMCWSSTVEASKQHTTTTQTNSGSSS